MNYVVMQYALFWVRMKLASFLPDSYCLYILTIQLYNQFHLLTKSQMANMEWITLFICKTYHSAKQTFSFALATDYIWSIS